MKQKEPPINISLTLTQLYGLCRLIHEHRRTTDTIKWGAYGERTQGAGILDDIITNAIVSYEHKIKREKELGIPQRAEDMTK